MGECRALTLASAGRRRLGGFALPPPELPTTPRVVSQEPTLIHCQYSTVRFN